MMPLGPGGGAAAVAAEAGKAALALDVWIAWAESVVGGTANATNNGVEDASTAEVDDEAGKAAVARAALAAWVAWAASMPESASSAEQAAVETAHTAAKAAVGGAADATEDAVKAARTAELEDEAGKAGKAEVAVAAGVAWAASAMKEVATFAEQATLQTAHTTAEAADGGAANATEDAAEAASTAEVADASAPAPSASGVWTALAAVAARDRDAGSVAEADGAAGKAVVDAAGTDWHDDNYRYYLAPGGFYSGNVNHRKRTCYRLGRYAGQAAAGAEWRRPNRRAKRRVARLVQEGAIRTAQTESRVLLGFHMRPNCPAGMFWLAQFDMKSPPHPVCFPRICPLCRDEEVRRLQRYLSR